MPSHTPRERRKAKVQPKRVSTSGTRVGKSGVRTKRR